MEKKIMLFRKENKIDELSREKRELVLKRDKLKRDMHNRNSKRETKIAILENAGQTDFENTNKKIVELDRQIEKVVRAIDSEQIYVNEVANNEKKEHLQAQKVHIPRQMVRHMK